MNHTFYLNTFRNVTFKMHRTREEKEKLSRFGNEFFMSYV